MKKMKIEDAAPADVLMLPRLRLPQQVWPSGPNGDPTILLRQPSIVVRVDGRYGVARLMRSDESARGVFGPYDPKRPPLVVGDSSCTTRLFHEPTTYHTRAEAEARAWKLARELGDTRDWP